MPPKIELTVFFKCLLLRVPQIVIFGMLGCCQIILVLKGAMNPKSLKNTGIEACMTLAVTIDMI